jgi:hypothetical protein
VLAVAHPARSASATINVLMRSSCKGLTELFLYTLHYDPTGLSVSGNKPRSRCGMAALLSYPHSAYRGEGRGQAPAPQARPVLKAASYEIATDNPYLLLGKVRSAMVSSCD